MDSIHKNPQKISLFTAVLMTINIMVGGGILVGPGLIAQVAGNASFLAWPLVGIIFLPLVLCMAQLTRMLPGAGGVYSYAKEGLNRTAGFLSGWAYIVGYSFAAAVEVLVLRQTLLVSVGNYWLIENALLFNGLCLLSCVFLNLLSLQVFSKILNSLTIAKILPLLILIALIPFVINANFTITGQELSMLPFSLPFAIFGYFGFEYACTISNLIENSERNASRALLIGFTLTMIIYTLFHFGLLNLMGAKNLAQFNASAFAQFITLPIPFIKNFLMVLIPAAAIATLYAGANGMINANATLLQAMAQEKLFTSSALLVSLNKYNRPWVAIALQGIVVFAIVMLIPNISIVGSLCNVGIFCSFILPFASLFVLQKRKGAYSSVLLALLALFIALFFMIYSWSLLSTIWHERVLYALLLFVPLFGGLLLLSAEERSQAGLFKQMR